MSNKHLAKDAENEILKNAQKLEQKNIILTISLLILIITAVIYSLLAGSTKINMTDLMAIINGRRGMVYNIIWNIRLPAVLTALVAGVGLALAGAVMQTILKNPLASPFTLGISHAAAFGAAFAIVVLDSRQFLKTVPLFSNLSLPALTAFFFAQLAVAFILIISLHKEQGTETIVLAGIAISSLFTAGTTILQFLADDLELASVVYWTFGDPGRTNWTQFFCLAVVVLIVVIYFIIQSWNYSLLNAGDEVAVSLGLNPVRMRLIALTIVSLLTSIIISLVGIIGFIGLVTPHIIRKISPGSQRQLFLNTSLAGALLLIIANNLARTLLNPVVLPVGVLTSFLGAPLFIYLIIKGRRYW
ncbi:FecCD family ABC transporter permease [Halanaerobium salsuginis]|jgi:iron complex transport system permease protein|uniref:Iron complex transport system permease protein n=1 Tax=Halanaerobium salsuginis TaxID=29563 RepID=A0A1I4IXG9_9FIRM|nr:iron ABC transporter permease [Halanaerobium salsuginis]SFL59062.1 iron complex transport system permease protein [Halanaerobium salsuginis]